MLFYPHLSRNLQDVIYNFQHEILSVEFLVILQIPVSNMVPEK